jgi:tetratricopeptide (TPR) repeat protein
MNIKSRFILFAAIVGMFISVNSCSVVNYFTGYVKSWESKSSAQTTRSSEMNRFIGLVRAPQGNPEAHNLLGDYYQGRDRHREAIEEFNKAIRVDPRFVKAYNGIAMSLDRMGEHEKAQDYYRVALAIQPDLDYLHNNLGYSYLLQERYEEAAAAFEKANAMSGGKVSRILNNLALANSALGKGDPSAMPADSKHLALIEYAAGNLRLKNGSFEEARGHYQKALSLEPGMRSARKGEEVAVLLAGVKRSMDKETALAQVGHEKPAVMLGRDGIEISNGNGVSRMAGEVGSFLKKQGFNIVRVTNADHFRYEKATVYYRGDAEWTARQILETIPGIREMKKVGGFDRDSIHVRIIVGKDLTAERKTFQEGEN